MYHKIICLLTRAYIHIYIYLNILYKFWPIKFKDINFNMIFFRICPEQKRYINKTEWKHSCCFQYFSIISIRDVDIKVNCFFASRTWKDWLFFSNQKQQKKEFLEKELFIYTIKYSFLQRNIPASISLTFWNIESFWVLLRLKNVQSGK